MFGVFGLVFASTYFLEGISLMASALIAFRSHEYRNFVWWFSVLSLDLITAAAAAIASVGLLCAQRWAEKMWVLTISILGFLHLLIAALSQLGEGVSTFYLIWTWMVILLGAMSWWYFTRTPATTPASEVAEPQISLPE
jgi:hypothetical protein